MNVVVGSAGERRAAIGSRRLHEKVEERGPQEAVPTGVTAVGPQQREEEEFQPLAARAVTLLPSAMRTTPALGLPWCRFHRSTWGCEKETVLRKGRSPTGRPNRNTPAPLGKSGGEKMPYHFSEAPCLSGPSISSKFPNFLDPDSPGGSMAPDRPPVWLSPLFPSRRDIP